MAISTIGISLSYKASSASTYTKLTGLLSVPALGGSQDSIEITTLDDVAHTYMGGLENYGDSIDFSFLFDPTQFTTLSGLSGDIDWQVGIPGETSSDDMTCEFSGSCSVQLDGKGTNEAITYTLSIKPSTAMVFA